MKLRDVRDLLNAEVIVGHDQLEKEITTACSADRMSDVLTYAKEGGLFLTGLTNPHVIRAADVRDIGAVIMVRDKRPSPETIRLSEELGIPLLTTKYILFETAGRLYSKGIVGCVESVGDESAAA